VVAEGNDVIALLLDCSLRSQIIDAIWAVPKESCNESYEMNVAGLLYHTMDEQVEYKLCILSKQYTGY
jgi:hypothetical protein